MSDNVESIIRNVVDGANVLSLSFNDGLEYVFTFDSNGDISGVYENGISFNISMRRRFSVDHNDENADDYQNAVNEWKRDYLIGTVADAISNGEPSSYNYGTSIPDGAIITTVDIEDIDGVMDDAHKECDKRITAFAKIGITSTPLDAIYFQSSIKNVENDVDLFIDMASDAFVSMNDAIVQSGGFVLSDIYSRIGYLIGNGSLKLIENKDDDIHNNSDADAYMVADGEPDPDPNDLSQANANDTDTDVDFDDDVRNSNNNAQNDSSDPDNDDITLDEDFSYEDNNAENSKDKIDANDETEVVHDNNVENSTDKIDANDETEVVQDNWNDTSVGRSDNFIVPDISMPEHKHDGLIDSDSDQDDNDTMEQNHNAALIEDNDFVVALKNSIASNSQLIESNDNKISDYRKTISENDHSEEIKNIEEKIHHNEDVIAQINAEMSRDKSILESLIENERKNSDMIDSARHEISILEEENLKSKKKMEWGRSALDALKDHNLI